MGGSISRLVYQPPEPTYADDHDDFPVIWLRNRFGTNIPAFYIENRRSRFTVLYSHGNAEDLGIAYDWASEFSKRLDVSVFAYDYTGYGLSSNPKPNEKATYADIDAAYEYLTRDLNVPTTRIVLYGRSLGSGPTVDLAHRLPPTGAIGCILHSPLASAYRVAFNTGFTLWGDMYPNIDKVDRVHLPLLVLHGTGDEVVPFAHGEKLHARAGDPREPWWVQGGGHNNLETRWRGEYYTRISTFLKEIEAEADAMEKKTGLRRRKKKTKDGNGNDGDADDGRSSSRSGKLSSERRRKKLGPASSLREVLDDDTTVDHEDHHPGAPHLVLDAGHERQRSSDRRNGSSSSSSRKSKALASSSSTGIPSPSRVKSALDDDGIDDLKRHMNSDAAADALGSKGSKAFRHDAVKYGRERVPAAASEKVSSGRDAPRERNSNKERRKY